MKFDDIALYVSKETGIYKKKERHTCKTKNLFIKKL